MHIHHLNCGTLSPAPGTLNRNPQAPGPVQLVCHVLLLETDAGLVLVDTGLGLADIAGAQVRLGTAFIRLLRPALREAETAYRQIQALDLDPADVCHIVLTHLDADHAGGLTDFPRAKVHILAAEHAAMAAGKNLRERYRYRGEQWSHRPDWVLHQAEGEPWHGFAVARQLPGLPPEILMLPLTGHTLGHAGVAVHSSTGWLLHAGDAYFNHGQLQAKPHCPLGLRLMQRLMAEHDYSRRTNIERLRTLARQRNPAFRIFCAHDSAEFDRHQRKKSI